MKRGGPIKRTTALRGRNRKRARDWWERAYGSDERIVWVCGKGCAVREYAEQWAGLKWAVMACSGRIVPAHTG